VDRELGYNYQVSEDGQQYDLHMRFETLNHPESCGNKNYTWYTNEQDYEKWILGADVGTSVCPADANNDDLYALPH
jgi:hypothetical protein